MSYAVYEEGAELGSPITLYLCRVGDDTEGLIGFTDHDEPVYYGVVFEGGLRVPVKFEPIPVSRNEFEDEGQGERANLTITTTVKNPLVDVFKDYPPAAEVKVMVFEGHADDPDSEFRTIWMGRCINMAWQDGGIEFQCQPAASSILRPALTRNWQHQCPLPLYSKGTGMCNAVKTPVEGEFLESGTGWIKVKANDFIGTVWMYETGTIELFGPNIKYRDLRTITKLERNAWNQFTAYVPGRIPKGITRIVLLKGCHHNEKSCIDWHNNIVNYGGQIFIPLENPTGKTSTYL